jgi:hypothetical protein
LASPWEVVDDRCCWFRDSARRRDGARRGPTRMRSMAFSWTDGLAHLGDPPAERDPGAGLDLTRHARRASPSTPTPTPRHWWPRQPRSPNRSAVSARRIERDLSIIVARALLARCAHRRAAHPGAGRLLADRRPGAAGARPGSPLLCRCSVVDRGAQPTMPSATPRRTASRRLATSSFDSSADTWWSTVLVEMNKRCAISAFVDPSARNFRISTSRLVRPAGLVSAAVRRRAVRAGSAPRDRLHATRAARYRAAPASDRE